MALVAAWNRVMDLDRFDLASALIFRERGQPEIGAGAAPLSFIKRPTSGVYSERHKYFRRVTARSLQGLVGRAPARGATSVVG